MKKEENIKIDIEKYNEQKKKSILKKGKYVRAEIIIETGTDDPIVNTSFRKCSSLDVAKLIATLEETYKQLQKTYPKEAILAKLLFEAKCMGIEKKGGK